MVKRKLIWQIIPYYIVIIIVALVAVAVYSSRQIRVTYTEEVTRELTSGAMIIEHRARDLVVRGDLQQLQELTATLADLSDSRVTIIDSAGRVLSDSEQDPALMENHGRRPELSMALDGQVGSAERYSQTLQTTMRYVAVPVTVDGVVVGAVRTALPVSDVKEQLTSLNMRIAIAGLVLIILATVISFFLFRRVSVPLDELKQGADRMASGDLTARLPLPDSAEISALAEAMNNMASQLDSRMKTIIRQRNEQQAILTSMTEGVLAVDTGERVLSVNDAAGRLLGIDPTKAKGKTIHELVRHPDLHEFISASLQSREPLRTEITITGPTDRQIQVQSSELRDASENLIGTVLVLNDITRIRMLENMRRDFVANVSHELRTPITAISGCVETLLDSQSGDPQEAERMLDIIGRQAGRLNSLVADLLTISKLEYDVESGSIEHRRVLIQDVVNAAVQACDQKSKEKNISVSVDGGSTVEIMANQPKMEQAIVNLIDNAIKYSDPNTKVTVKWTQADNEVTIIVEDQGPGIEKKHLPRLFERFYRIDRARSREMGGTGLGLAIVKHIALVHDGKVSVESTPGVGSIFRIHLPAIS